MAKLVWRVKVVADLGTGAVSGTEVALIERDDLAVPETVGLRLDEGKRLMAAIQADIVRAQAAAIGERFRWCEHCGAKLWSKGYYPATFRSVFGDVPLKIRRLSACRCRSGPQEPRSFAATIAEKTSVTPQERNIAYLSIIYENECTYCMAGHANLSRMAKVDNATIAAMREGRPTADGKLEALRQFAAKITRQRGVVSEADVGRVQGGRL